MGGGRKREKALYARGVSLRFRYLVSLKASTASSRGESAFFSKKGRSHGACRLLVPKTGLKGLSGDPLAMVLCLGGPNRRFEGADYIWSRRVYSADDAFATPPGMGKRQRGLWFSFDTSPDAGGALAVVVVGHEVVVEVDATDATVVSVVMVGMHSHRWICLAGSAKRKGRKEVHQEETPQRTRRCHSKAELWATSAQERRPAPRQRRPGAGVGRKKSHAPRPLRTHARVRRPAPSVVTVDECGC